MRLSRKYEGICFPGKVIEQAFDILGLPGEKKWDEKFMAQASSFNRIEEGRDAWVLDTLGEWLDRYGRGFSFADLHLDWDDVALFIQVYFGDTMVQVGSRVRGKIDRVVKVFDDGEEEIKKGAVPDRPIIFIGHGGGSRAWCEIRDELQGKHGLEIETFEAGSRGGISAFEVLRSMAKKCSFAIMVFSAEDELRDGSMRARQNVVHEAGFMQSSLGASRVMMVVEKGVDMFSNIHGLQCDYYDHGHVKEVISSLLATLRREFPGAV
ncbi:TIR domain-containing protein [Arachnia propionica]|uniref:CD-NTase-associated protein 12/Pycsar effector protein TIR domain-containing protein n=1 Tax=Arachnia propionica TaxID=1750 RepID=A0A3P1WQ85_9ACTN|nr:TIR domain-containing protein [Arachnia propionica]RRD48762.1 hypothetical protein EII35_11180 [Arachnia propionica]